MMIEGGAVYYDCDGRKLRVEEVCFGDPLGREIRGIVGYKDNYSCDLKTWEEVWRDRVPRLAPSKMKI